jgi:hypothetical protein
MGPMARGNHPTECPACRSSLEGDAYKSCGERCCDGLEPCGYEATCSVCGYSGPIEQHRYDEVVELRQLRAERAAADSIRDDMRRATGGERERLEFRLNAAMASACRLADDLDEDFTREERDWLHVHATEEPAYSACAGAA